MEAFSALLVLCAGNSAVTDQFPSQSQWRGHLKFSLICAWTNSWINNRNAGDLRRQRAHHDVTLMFIVNSNIHSVFTAHYCLVYPYYNHDILYGNMWCINSKEHLLPLDIPLCIYDDFFYIACVQEIIAYTYLQVFVGARSIRPAEGGLLKNGCELSDNDIEILHSMWSNMTSGDKFILHRERRGVTEPAAWCPYTTQDTDLGADIYPRIWSNATCQNPTAGLCSSTPEPGADVTSKCEPIYYSVRVFRLTTSTRVRTSKCVLETYREHTVQLVVGCSCRTI